MNWPRLAEWSDELWQKQQAQLKDQVALARIGFHSRLYLYTWGVLLGFLLVAVAGVGFLHPAQPTSRRVVGAIVLCVQVVFLFTVYLIQSTGAIFSAGRY